MDQVSTEKKMGKNINKKKGIRILKRTHPHERENWDDESKLSQ